MHRLGKSSPSELLVELKQKLNTYRVLHEFLNALGGQLAALGSQQNVDISDAGARAKQLFHEHLAHEAGGAGDEDIFLVEKLLHRGHVIVAKVRQGLFRRVIRYLHFDNGK